MTTQLELHAQQREVLGKRVAQLRRAGTIPANLFGHNQTSVSIQVNEVALQKLLSQGGNHVVSLTIGDGSAVQALIKRVQRNSLNGKPIHVDFYQLASAETLKTQVHLQFINESALSKHGDVTISQALNEVMVECLPSDLPASIHVDLSTLTEIGSTIRVGNLKVGPGVTILTDANETVAGIRSRNQGEKTEEPTPTPALS